MKKMMILFLFIVLISPANAFSSETFSVQFTMMIPKIMEIENTADQIKKVETKTDDQILTTEKTIREGKPAIIKTIVAK